MAPRQLDLHLIVFSVLFTPLTDEQAAAFRHGYGLVELDETRLVRYACVRALEDLVATAHGLDIELVEAAERGEVGQREGSVGHVEVFRTGSLRTSIIGGPRPRSSPHSSHHGYTLVCEEPENRMRQKSAQCTRALF
ncbi:hypothetical protein [Curtobacterium sp. MCBD17_028]|uniref:hypothetical protein n=1 Tax=Curtobacterium sp. MCBD17_028 TaxID=2175670 RepID=UPI000DAA5574|nr:hypothetical protein [Curtobacterium sp. MCBD17_028]PZE23466.1 hypothetical protein DEI86_14630 [Curtobacterium sp. MCBD17_028]